MIPTAISTTQPTIGYSYSAFVRVEGRNEPAEVLIVYRAYQDGKHIIYDGKNLYRSDRTSPEDQEPVFCYDDSDIIKDA